MPRRSYVAMFGFLACYCLMLVTAVSTHGIWLAVFGVCLIGPLNTVYVAWQWEGRRLAEILDPRRASWAFLADPAIAMAAAAFTAAKGAGVTWSQWLTMFGVSLIAAAGGAKAIRVIDKPRYMRYEALGSFNSASKLAHDFFCLPLLCGAVVSTGAMAVWESAWNGWFWLGLSCIGIWLIGAVEDLIREPNPLEQHPNKEWAAQ